MLMSWLTPKRSLLLVLIAAATVHVAVLAVAHHRTGSVAGFAFRSLDTREFYQLARNLAEHGQFAHRRAPQSGGPLEAAPPLTPDTWRTPGYPLVLAGIIRALGDSPTVLVLFQQVLSLVNVILLFGLARRWMSARRAAVASLLFLIEPYGLYYSLWLMATTVFVTVLLLAWHAWQLGLERRKTGWFALLGALTGFLVLIRPIGLLIPIVLAVGLASASLRRRRNKARKADRRGFLTPVSAMVACSLLVVGGWMWRNHAVAGHFALSDQGGVVLAYFKAAEVELWRQGRTQDRFVETSLSEARRDEPHAVWDEIDRRLQERFAHLPAADRATLQWKNLAQGNAGAVDPFLVSGVLRDVAVAYFADHPVSTAVCYLWRCVSTLTFPLSLAIKPPTGIESSRVRWTLLGTVYLLLCIAVLVRLIAGVRAGGGLRFDQLYFPLASTFALLLATTPQLDPRFRVPMIPLLIVVALLPRTASTDADRP